MSAHTVIPQFPGLPVLNVMHQQNDVQLSQPSQSSQPPSSSGGVSTEQDIRRSYWTTDMFDCCADEESCWWTLWCSCLVAARTTEVFDLGYKSFDILIKLFVISIAVIICLCFAITLAIPLMCGLVGYVLFTRATVRGKIRNKLGYVFPNGDCDDCVKHLCCSNCAICQEAREAKAYSLNKIDFCSGQPLSDLEEAHERAVGRLADISEVLLPQNGTFGTHLQALSQLSKYLIGLHLALLILVFVHMIATGGIDQALVLLLIFIQPLALLYIFYWRLRRQFASLDMVSSYALQLAIYTHHFPSSSSLPPPSIPPSTTLAFSFSHFLPLVLAQTWPCSTASFYRHFALSYYLPLFSLVFSILFLFFLPFNFYSFFSLSHSLCFLGSENVFCRF